MNFSKLISDYIRDQWNNFKRALNAPQATEELLCGATIAFYEPGSTVPMASYADPELQLQNPHPVMADSRGNFNPIYLDPSKPTAMKLFDLRGNLILSDEEARKYCNSCCPTCGHPIN